MLWYFIVIIVLGSGHQKRGGVSTVSHLKERVIEKEHGEVMIKKEVGKATADPAETTQCRRAERKTRGSTAMREEREMRKREEAEGDGEGVGEMERAGGDAHQEEVEVRKCHFLCVKVEL